MMNTVLEVLVSSSVLITALAALRFFLRGKISARLQYALWLLAALRLLVPVSLVSSPVSVMNAVPEAAIEQTPFVFEQTGTSQWDTIDSKPLPASTAVDETAQAEEKTVVQNEPEASSRLSTQAVLAIVWAAGSALTLGFILTQNLRAAKRLKENRVQLDVQEAEIPVYRTEELATPCLFGLVRPSVYLTKSAFDADGNPDAFVLRHELTHYRRRDHIWCALRLLCTAAYWFDPFVWLAAKLSKLDCELACDEAVLRGMDDLERIAYGRALLGQVSPKQDKAYLAACATTMASGKRALRTRIRRIAKKQKTTAVALVLAVAVCVVLAACTFTKRTENVGPSSSGDLPAMLQVDGTLYVIDLYAVSDEDAARVEKTGEIKSYVDYSETPSEDDQANFPDIGREYGVLDGQLVAKNSQGQWKYTIMQLPREEVEAAVDRYAPDRSVGVVETSRRGTLYVTTQTNADKSVDVLLYLVGKVDGEVQVTHTAEGRFDDTCGYGIYQTQFENQTVVFGLFDPQGMRDSNIQELTSVDYDGITMYFDRGSKGQSLMPSSTTPFALQSYDAGEVPTVQLVGGYPGTTETVATFTDIPMAGENGTATLTVNEPLTAAAGTQAPQVTDVDQEAIRQAVYERFSTAQWDWDTLTEDEARTFEGTDSRENGMIGNYPNYYGAFADYFAAAGRAPSDEEVWTITLPRENLMALSIHQYGEQVQKLYYCLGTGTLCGFLQEPQIDTDTRVGIGISTDYADENIVVFHGYFGLFVYDLNRSEITFSMDLGAATGTTNMQGSYAVSVFVEAKTETPEIMVTYYDMQRVGESPLSYYIDAATGEIRYSPTVYPENGFVSAGTQAHNVEMVTDNVKDLTYSDGTKTWKLFKNWDFGTAADGRIVPLTNPASGGEDADKAAFFDLFYELDERSMQAYLDEHPEALANGWAGIRIDASGLDEEGTSIHTKLGEQVLAVNYEQSLLLLCVEGKSYRGVLAVAKNPARLRLANAANLGTQGQLVGEIGEANGAILAMTASGVPETDEGEGALPAGYAMSSGVGYGEHFAFPSDSGYCRAEVSNDNVLSIVPTQDAVGKTCRDAVETVPALILDGETQALSGWTEQNARTCIGQSGRLEMLLLAIEGRNPEDALYGATLSECAEILARHNARQAANLSGGNRAMLWYNGRYITRGANPATRETGGRALPNAFIYK